MKLKKYYPYLAVLFTIFFYSCTGGSGTKEKESLVEDSTATDKGNNVEDAKIASPRKQAKGKIDGVSVVVDYGSPGVKGRKVWGGLEEWDAVWRAGANETTSVEFGQDVSIGGNVVQAGKYGIYMIPKENGDWVFILSTDWSREMHGSWGAYNYTDENDVLRMAVKPEWVDENRERLEYSVGSEGINFAWEKVRLTVPVEKSEAGN